jgi:hypothetical protein
MPLYTNMEEWRSSSMHLQYLSRWCEVVIIVIERLCVEVQFMGEAYFRSRRCRTLNFILRSNY